MLWDASQSLKDAEKLKMVEPGPIKHNMAGEPDIRRLEKWLCSQEETQKRHNGSVKIQEVIIKTMQIFSTEGCLLHIQDIYIYIL